MISIASAVSQQADTTDAAVEVAASIAEEIGGRPDLLTVFFSNVHAPHAEALAEILRVKLEPSHLLGCTGEWVVSGGREFEEGPVLSVWAAKLPETTVEAYRLRLVRTEDRGAIVGFPELDPGDLPEAVLLLADPFSFPTDALLEHAARTYPGLRFVGGMASGGRAPGENRLLSDGNMFDVGAVAVTLRGGVRVDAVVSQGCRPVGESYVVTRSTGNTIEELASRRPLDVVRDTFASATSREQELLQQGLHVGVVVDEYKESFGRGDFLVRNVVGADQESGALVVGETVDVGQTVQFHVRDAESADEDLRLLLQDAPASAAGALLFTCNGRGSRLFGSPDHDAQLVAGLTPAVAGLFCNGEVGPIGSRSFVHGFTASIALFSDPA